jgi:drug/metabolite transporter (DMT)-like permease
LAALAGAAFGALTVAVRFGLDRGGDAHSGAAASAVVGALASAAVAALELQGRDPALESLWPFLVVGLAAPGVSQTLLTLAVRHAGPSRAAIVMGTSPVLSFLIACFVRGEPLRPALATGTGMIVLGGVASVGGHRLPARSRLVGPALALVCAMLFAARDNLLDVAAVDSHPSPLAATAAMLCGASVTALIPLASIGRTRVIGLARVVVVFAPAGLILAVAYAALLEALDRGDVTVVSPLLATGSAWSVLLASLLVGRSEMIGRRTIAAVALVVAGGALIGSGW